MDVYERRRCRMNFAISESWHDKAIDEIATRLATDMVHGLSAPEAVERLAKTGPNELRRGEAISPLAILAGQFRSLVIWVLIGAALVSTALGELIDGLAIIAIVLLNALIGFFQEYRAERAPAVRSAPSCRWGSSPTCGWS